MTNDLLYVIYIKWSLEFGLVTNRCNSLFVERQGRTTLFVKNLFKREIIYMQEVKIRLERI